MARVGLVVIGRNEGERLRTCLTAALSYTAQVVYVDSGSTDGSVAMARSLGATVIELDLSLPFTAARARNTGWEYLLQCYPDVEYIQFVDGDCELVGNWLEMAERTLDSNPKAAVVYGRRSERDRDRTPYNRLCDMEWHNLLKYAGFCGGDAMIRAIALQQVGGYNPALIAGEEPEFCLRLRQQGWQMLPLNLPMTLHDAQMTRFSQWWRRMMRAGHAYAEGAALHGKEPERFWVKESRSILLWSLGLPLIALGLIPVSYSASLLLLLLYPLMVLRIARWMHQQEFSWFESGLYGLSCVLGKFPSLIGQFQFHWRTRLGKTKTLIEYK